ncbi:MAG TPA: hypothetical protein VFW05_05505 [Verrucomicrobiae bacterium]|jgi:hypothetical protein|nr:hypothetical protein [Verrucomicrobiae bacterium]
MKLIDFILNLAGLLLWLNWRSHRLDPLTHATPATLVGTIKRTRSTKLSRWNFLLAVAGLIFFRAWFYLKIGSAVDWTPRLHLGAVVLPFPMARNGQDFFLAALLFSGLSFLRMVLIFYFWLMLVVIINRRVTNPDPVHKFLLLQLGRAAYWPRWLQLIIPLIASAILWLIFYPLLARLGIINWAQSHWHVAGQSAVAGLSLFFSLKYLLPSLLLLHLIESYVYLGNSAFWDFVNTTSRNLLLAQPLPAGKLDLIPMLGLILMILIFFFPLPQGIHWLLDYFQLTLWPG